MRFNFLFIFLLATGLIFLNSTFITGLLWQENKPLTFQQFKGPVDIRSRFVSSTNTTLDLHIVTQKNNMAVDVSTYFDPAKSWIKSNATADILKHEQLHFDITEIYARELRKKVKSLERLGYNKNVLQTEIRQAFSSIAASMRNEQIRYDNETNHSTIADMQKRWTDSVAIRLNNLKVYKK